MNTEPGPAKSLALQREPKLPDLTKYGFEFSVHGLKPIGAPSREQCFEAMHQLRSYGAWLQIRVRAWQLAVGDLWNYCQDRFGEDAFQLVDHLDYERATLYQWGSVAKRIPMRTRVQMPLDYSYYREVSRCETLDERQNWLQKAADEHLTIKELHAEIHENGGNGKVVPTEVAVLPGTWRERAAYLLASRNDDSARATAETYIKCAEELVDAAVRDRANGLIESTVIVLDDERCCPIIEFCSRSHHPIALYPHWPSETIFATVP